LKHIAHAILKYLESLLSAICASKIVRLLIGLLYADIIVTSLATKIWSGHKS